MHADTRLRLLLGKGYFPKELPPTFTTEDFGLHSRAILAEWQKLKLFQVTAIKKKRGLKRYECPNTDSEVISTPKRGFERRNLHVTHPLPQALLAAEISDNWVKVQKWLSLQTYSVDRINFAPNSARALANINFSLHTAKKGFIEASNDWIVRTDITRFYPSIYTHSIPWAAYGKENVKSDLKKHWGSLADRLDLLVRKCNRNQTIGIPIGPDTSRILAEIISCRIDCMISRTPMGLPPIQADRLQDDWLVGLKSNEKAEGALSGIARVYREFGLDINGSKTSIERLRTPSVPQGIAEMSAYVHNMKGAVAGQRLVNFFYFSLATYEKYSSESIISYALTVLESQQIRDSDLPAVESFLLKSASIAPLTLDRICRILVNLDRTTAQLSHSRLGPRLTELLERHIEQGNEYEAIWLVHTLRGLKIPLKSRLVVEAVEHHRSAVLPLILLDMRSKKLCRPKLPTSKWETSFTEDGVNNDCSWLLAYEGIRHGWLTDKQNLMNKPLFRPLITRNVVFYDDHKNVSASRAVAASRRKSRVQWKLEVARLVRRLRDFPPTY